jgi:RimJ/RimL family protein N-acetyltransferase
MYEIEPAAYEQVRPFFPNLDVHLAVKALLTGNVQGQVYVDDSARPKSVMARIGELFYLGGSPEQQAFNRALSQFFAEIVYPQRIAAGPGRFIVKCTVDGWAQQMDMLLPGKFPIPKRQQYYLSGEVRHDWRAMLPPDITIRWVDRALLAEGLEGLDGLLEEMRSERPSVEEFLDKSFGFVPVRGNEIIGWCLSEYNCGDRCEIGIATAEGYRRRGLATLLASAFIEYARVHGIAHIGWNCDANNTASIATALKLGFTRVLEYPVFLCFRNEGFHLAVGGDHCFMQHHYAEAAEWYERAIQHGDAPAGVYVDSACAHAMSGRNDMAFQRLYEAVDRGFSDADYLLTLPWLESLRGTAAWTRLMQQIDAKQRVEAKAAEKDD